MHQIGSPVVLVDMDGVLADFESEFLSRTRNKYPDIILRKNRQNFYITEDYPEHIEKLKKLVEEPGFFEALPLVKNAAVGWQKILDLGYHPIVCSSPLRANPKSRDEKLNWLSRHFEPIFGHSVLTEAIITSHKDRYDGIALIDDRPIIKNSESAAWQHIVFDRSYNQTSSAPRLMSWLDNNLSILLRNAQLQYQHRN